MENKPRWDAMDFALVVLLQGKKNKSENNNNNG